MDILREIDDWRSVAVDLGQLGTLALLQRDYAEARRRYAEALAAFQALGEPETEAVAWHQLGRVAEEQRAWDEAERCYRESLRLKEAGNNLAGVARTANQLGLVCKNAGRPDEAETWWKKALNHAELLPDQGARVLNNLAGLLLDVAARPPAARPAAFAARDLLAEAEAYAHRAREILEALNDPSTEVWKTYNILAQIAARRGRPDEARGWRRREQASYAAFAGAWAQLPGWAEPVAQAVVAACRGNREAKKQVEALFPQLEAGNWRIVDAIRRIWAGERDLDTLTDGIDAKSALIVRGILALLAGACPPTPPPPAAGRLAVRAGPGGRGEAGG